MTTVSATALVVTKTVRTFTRAGAPILRNSRTLNEPITSVAAATMPASTVNATRRAVLLNSGPPGRKANAQMKAQAVAITIQPVSLLIVPAGDSLGRILFDHRRMSAAITDMSTRKMRTKLAAAVTRSI